jgi:hypothetical protein
MLSLVELAEMSALGREIACFDCDQIEADLIPLQLVPNEGEKIIIEQEDTLTRLCLVLSFRGSELEVLQREIA